MDNIQELLLPGWNITKNKRVIKLEKNDDKCKYIILFHIYGHSYSAMFGGGFSSSWDNPYQLKIEEHLMIHNLMKSWGWIE